MNAEEFDACFDRFTTSAFRLEALQRYAVDEADEDFIAWRDGRPRPERSIRTEPWLARVADTTLNEGKRWSRVHVVDHPLSEYMSYELVAYQQNVTAGEDIRIADRRGHPELASLNTDFWLFDAELPTAFAVLMRYDPAGNWLGADRSDDPAVLDRCRAQRDLALGHSVSLNAYLAQLGAKRAA